MGKGFWGHGVGDWDYKTVMGGYGGMGQEWVFVAHYSNVFLEVLFFVCGNTASEK